MVTGTQTRIETADQGVDRQQWHDRASRLHDELRRPATGLVRRAFGSTFGADEIDDIYSSAWLGTLRALERKHHQMDDEEVRKYLLTAVANHASKEIRRRRRKPIAPLDAAGSVAEVADTPEDTATGNEQSRITRDVLASLPERRRAVMLLRYGWGLEPKEVCGMVKGLSPRAYRKEITRGVEEVTRRMRLVEAGRWCADREDVLTAFAAGTADDHQKLQAEQHLSHCRHCTEFVGKLSSHLHDIGSALAVPGAIGALDGSGMLERLGDILDRGRDAMVGAGTRADSASEAISSASAMRGGGTVGAGVLAKLAGLGGAGKLAAACLTGGVAATACVAAGLTPNPIDVGGAGDVVPKIERVVSRSVEASDVRDVLASAEASAEPPAVSPSESEPTSEPREVVDPVAVVAPTAPPTEQEFGVASGAVPAAAPASAGGGGGGAVAQEFGP